MKKLICAVTVLAVSTAQAATIHVDIANCPGPGDGSVGNPYCSIQTAIDNAVDTDEIVVAPGTYNEAINFLGKAITLRSSDGPEVTIIDGTGFFTHVVQCVSGEGLDTILDGFTITGGNARGNIPDNLGGGMLNTESSPTVMNCVFSGNTAQAGGGMYNYLGSFPTVTNCTFSGNLVAGGGGGMSNALSSPTVTDCTFSGNAAGVVGGAMYNIGGTPMVTNCTFSDNSAGGGGGMFNRDNSSPIVTNCIVWGSTNGEIVNLPGAAPTVSYSDVQGGWPGLGNIDADPLFVDPDNGNLRLQPGSPCIDAGDNIAVPAGITTDLDGNPRFVDDPDTIDSGNGDPPIVDMGAYEFQGAPPCPWDCGGDDDGNVGIVDFLALLAQWGTLGSCNIDGDGSGVGINDFLALLANWGPCP